MLSFVFCHGVIIFLEYAMVSLLFGKKKRNGRADVTNFRSVLSLDSAVVYPCYDWSAKPQWEEFQQSVSVRNRSLPMEMLQRRTHSKSGVALDSSYHVYIGEMSHIYKRDVNVWYCKAAFRQPLVSPRPGEQTTADHHQWIPRQVVLRGPGLFQTSDLLRPLPWSEGHSWTLQNKIYGSSIPHSTELIKQQTINAFLARSLSSVNHDIQSFTRGVNCKLMPFTWTPISRIKTRRHATVIWTFRDRERSAKEGACCHGMGVVKRVALAFLHACWCCCWACSGTQSLDHPPLSSCQMLTTPLTKHTVVTWLGRHDRSPWLFIYKCFHCVKTSRWRPEFHGQHATVHACRRISVLKIVNPKRHGPQRANCKVI